MNNDHNILLEAGTNELEVLELFLNHRTDSGDGACYLGVNVAKVMQVIEAPELQVPESATNPCFMGIIPLRGMTVPVLDLGKWLGLNVVRHKHDVIMVTQFSGTTTGFLVSGVTNIHRVGWGDVQPPGRFLAGIGADSVVGIVKMDDKFIQLVDLEHIIADLDASTRGQIGIGIKAPRRYRAIVSDDSPSIRNMLIENLKAANIEPLIATNGHEALTMLRAEAARAAEEKRPLSDFVDILVSDIEMPLMDGLSLTKTIKQDPQTKDVPVILYSSLITPELRHKGESVGADDQISKPDLASMAQRIITLMEEKRLS
ncbi:chemotaxis protein [Oleidesulfovibrio sp.]|uniref:chemotaxis protein n=1 Tax=Oleidesulfovibrio sp. TaxID=2909707 RepID=UPI003A88B966